MYIVLATQTNSLTGFGDRIFPLFLSSTLPEALKAILNDTGWDNGDTVEILELEPNEVCIQKEFNNYADDPLPKRMILIAWVRSDGSWTVKWQNPELEEKFGKHLQKLKS